MFDVADLFQDRITLYLGAEKYMSICIQNCKIIGFNLKIVLPLKHSENLLP